MLYLCIGKRSRESSVQVKTYRSVLVDGLLMTYNVCRAHHTLVLHQQTMCDVSVVQLARAFAT